MRNLTKMLLVMVALLVPVFLVACGDGGGAVSGGRHIEGNIYSESRWTALEGGFLLNSRLAPIAIEATLLNQDLDSIGSVDVNLQRHRNGKIVFTSDSIELKSSLLRIKYSCVYADSPDGITMDFVQYVDIDKDSIPELSLLGALQSKRILFLVQEDGFYFESASRKAMREIRSLLDFDTQDKQTLNDLIYQICIIEKPDTAFYANYEKMRNSIGEDKTWRDLFQETEIADTLFNHNRQEKLWTESFGLPACDSSNYKDTASATNKESAYYKKPFVCDNPEYSNRYKWRLMTELEKEIGVCTPALRDTLEFEHTVYTCDSAKAKWQKMPDKQGIPYLYGECKSETEGDSVLYDSTYYACTSLKDWRSNIVYEWKVPAGEQWNDSVNVLVRKHEGLCNGERNGETTIIDGKYYLCKDAAWREIDRYTYFLGECESQGWNLWTAHHDSVGYFMCKRGEWSYTTQGYTSKWEEILIPDFYGDKCTLALENYVKEYDGIYFICKNKWNSESSCFWKVIEDRELSVPLRHGKLCSQENNGEVIEIDGAGYWCVFPNWEEATDYHLTVLRAVERNKLAHDYCRDGSANTTIFWDDTDSALYGCVNSYTYVNEGWGEVRRAPTNATTFTEFKDPKNLLGGIYEDDGHYTISRDGWTYTFSHYTTGVNDDRRKYLRLQKIVPPAGTTLNVTETDERMVFWAAIGDSAATLDKVEEKSPSFDNYFTDWKQTIVESTKCPDATLPGISCVSDWDESTIEVKFNNYNKDSYTTLEQAKAFCPEGTRIPSAEEWQAYNFIKADRAMLVEQVKGDGNTGKFSAKYSLAWTSTEKDADTQYCFEYVVKNNGWNDVYVASGIVECPKDLYPMVQAYCVNDGREE